MEPITIECRDCGECMTVADNGWTAIRCQGCGNTIGNPSMLEASLAIGRHVGRPMGVAVRQNQDGTFTSVDVFWTRRVGGIQCNHWRVERCNLDHLHVSPA